MDVHELARRIEPYLNRELYHNNIELYKNDTPLYYSRVSALA